VSLPEISTGNDISAHWVQCFSFFGDFWQPGEKKKKTEATEGTNGFFGENLGPSRQIMRKQNLSSSHLENSFQQVSQIKGGIVKFSTSPSSQICLSPLGHDCQVQNFENKITLNWVVSQFINQNGK
jgi:hypothetical protein